MEVSKTKELLPHWIITQWPSHKSTHCQTRDWDHAHFMFMNDHDVCSLALFDEFIHINKNDHLNYFKVSSTSQMDMSMTMWMFHDIVFNFNKPKAWAESCAELLPCLSHSPELICSTHRRKVVQFQQFHIPVYIEPWLSYIGRAIFGICFKQQYALLVDGCHFEHSVRTDSSIQMNI